MARRRYSTREKIVTLSQSFTQKKIARMLRVSERTVRRWKNEGVEPATPQRAARLQRSFESEAKRVGAALRRDIRKHPEAPRIEKRVRVVPKGERRVLAERAAGKKTGRFVESAWINYDVSKMNVKEIHAILAALRDDDRVVQLIYKIPKGGRYPRDARGRPGRQVSKPVRTGSSITDLSNLDDADLMDFLLTFTDPEPGPKSRRILFVSALDRKPR